MTIIRIHNNTSTDEIRIKLSDFRPLSKVEASIAEDGDKKTIVLHEVHLAQRLWRWISQNRDQRAQAVANSRRALLELADTKPAFKTLLGTSIQHKSEWSAAELHQALTAKISRLPHSKDGGGLAVNLQGRPLVVTNARAVDIKADSQVTWLLAPGNPQLWLVQNLHGNHSGKEIKVAHSSSPTPDQMREAYQTALANASGHFVITPIKNFEKGSISDESLTVLLEEIDNARNNNPNLRAVTIASEDGGERSLAGRIEDLEAARKSAQQNTAIG